MMMMLLRDERVEKGIYICVKSGYEAKIKQEENTLGSGRVLKKLDFDMYGACFALAYRI